MPVAADVLAYGGGGVHCVVMPRFAPRTSQPEGEHQNEQPIACRLFVNKKSSIPVIIMVDFCMQNIIIIIFIESLQSKQ